MARHAGTPSILWTDRPGQSRAADAVQPTIPCARSQPHSPSRAAIGRVTLALAGLPRPGHAAHDKGAGTEFVAISEWLRLRASLPRRMNGRSPWRREVHLSDTKTPAAANRQPCEPHIGDGLQPCLLACASSRSARRAIKSTEINTKTLAYSLYMPVELRIPIQKLSGLKSKPTKSLAMVVYGVHSYVRHSWTQTAIKCLDCAPWVIISFKAKQRRVVYWKRQAQFVVTMLKCVCGGVSSQESRLREKPTKLSIHGTLHFKTMLALTLRSSHPRVLWAPPADSSRTSRARRPQSSCSSGYSPAAREQVATGRARFGTAECHG